MYCLYTATSNVMPDTGSVINTESSAISMGRPSGPIGNAGGRVINITADLLKARLGVYELPTVSAFAVGIVTKAPGEPITIVPGAATPLLTTYLLVVSAANVTTSPALTVPVPVAKMIDVLPTAVEPE